MPTPTDNRGSSGTGSPFFISGPGAPSIWSQLSGMTGGPNNQGDFVQSNPNQSSGLQGLNGWVSPFYNQLNNSGDPNYVPSPLNLTPGQRQAYIGQYTGLTDAGGGPPQPSVGDQFIQQALNALNQQVSGPSEGDLRSQANNQAALKYDPLIQQLQQNLGTAKTNEADASNKIGGLYGSLGKALAAQMPVITNQFNAAEDRSQQNYQALQDSINQNYQGAKDAQAAELQKLNIQAALPQSTQRLNEDQQYLSGQANNNGQALNDAMRLMSQGESDFAQRASMIAPMQGANLQADLASKLNTLQNQINQQIAGYKGQEASAAADLYSQLQAAAAKSSASQQQQNFDNVYKMAELEKLTHPDAFAIPKDPKATKYSGISGVGNYFADNKDVADPNQLMQDFMGFATSKDYAGLTGPGGIGSPTLESAWQGLQQYATQNDPSITPGALQELYNALAIKYGKYS